VNAVHEITNMYNMEIYLMSNLEGIVQNCHGSAVTMSGKIILAQSVVRNVKQQVTF
jgi:hypothetical protein